MFDLYYENFEKDHEKAKILYKNPNRSDEEALIFFRLMKKNGEAIDGMKLESASKSYIADPSKMRKLKQYEKEYINMEKNIVKKKDSNFYGNDENDLFNDKVRVKIKKIQLLEDAQNNLYNADNIADDVNYLLIADKEKINKNQYRIKLLGEELVISNEFIKEIKKIDNRSKMLYYLTLAFPLLAIISGLFVKLIITAKSV